MICHESNKAGLRTALTLLEMVIAMAIMGVVFAAVLPQFRAIQNSWDSKQAVAETVQSGRVLMDHLYRNLSKAAKVTAVSGAAETSGYIEFEDNDGDTSRYDIDPNGYVEFGPVGSLSELAGTVTKLQFRCYDMNDLATAITDFNSIRFVRVETTFVPLVALGREMSFSTAAFLRTNWDSRSYDCYLGTVLRLNPIGYWRLGDTSGAIALEQVSSLDGLYCNGVTLGVGGALSNDTDTAVQFDGFNDQMRTLSSNCLHIDRDMSASFWINISRLPWWSRKDIIFGLRSYAEEEDYALMASLSVNKTGGLYYRHEYDEEGEEGQSHTFSTANLTVDTWYNITLTRDASLKIVYLYINGSLIDTYTYYAQPGGFGPGRLYLGRYSDSEEMTFGEFHGRLDEMVLFDRTLDGAEIDMIYNARTGISP